MGGRATTSSPCRSELPLRPSEAPSCSLLVSGGPDSSAWLMPRSSHHAVAERLMWISHASLLAALITDSPFSFAPAEPLPNASSQTLFYARLGFPSPPSSISPPHFITGGHLRSSSPPPSLETYSSWGEYFFHLRERCRAHNRSPVLGGS